MPGVDHWISCMHGASLLSAGRSGLEGSSAFGAASAQQKAQIE